MTNAKTTKRALLSSIVSLILCFTMLLSTTYAWFTDTVVSDNNIITAGNLDIELEYNKVVNGKLTRWDKVQGSSTIFDPNALWEPGRVEVVYLKVSNLGSLALKYQLGVNVVEETPGTNVEGNEFKLSEYLVFKVIEMDQAPADDSIHTASDTADTGLGLKDYNGKTTPMNVGDTDYVALIVYMPETVGNKANYKTGTITPKIELGINLYATQLNAESEKDSFGSDYDEGATHEKFKVTTANDLQNAVNNAQPGDTIEVENNLVLDEPIVIPAAATTFAMRSTPAPVVIDLNGKTISNENGYVIENQGNIVITGNGTLSGLGIIRSKAGSVVIENGNFYASSKWQDGVYQHTLKAENSDVVINGGNFDATVNGQTNAMLNASENATITINGGAFKNVAGELTQFDPYIFTYEKNGAVVINNGTFYGGWRFNGETATTDIYGGTFAVGFDGQSFHANSTHVVTVYGGTFTANTKLATKLGDLVADGFKAVEADGTYTVMFPQESFDDLIEDAQPGDTIQIPAGNFEFPASKLQAGVTLECAEGTVFTGTSKLNINGATVVGATFSNPNGTAADQTINGTFKNCVFEGKNALRWCYAGDVVVFEDCVFNATSVYAIHFDGMTGKDVTFKNCQITGWVAIAGGQKSLTFDGCEIYGNGTYGVIRVYGDTTIKNCTFDVDNVNTADVYQDGIHAVGCTVIVENCTNVNGEIVDLFNISDNAVITLDGMTVLTPSNINTVTPTSNTEYLLVGDFGGNNVALTMAVGVENVVFDGSHATGINELIITQNGQLIDNATTPIGDRSGNVTVQNFNVLSQINVFACKTEVVVQKNTAEALMIYAGNCDVKVLNNTIDANFESHPTYRNANTTWNTNNYGIALNIFDYNLWLDGNTVTDATGHAIGINGWEGTIDNGDANVIESFKDNKITVNSTSNTKRAAFKVWDDETYASNDGDTNVVNEKAQAFINAVLADGSNTFNIADGYNHTIFSFYNVNTNN